jgi:hypothetical protein
MLLMELMVLMLLMLLMLPNNRHSDMTPLAKQVTYETEVSQAFVLVSAA